MLNPHLPAEWEPQDAILLLWPHKDTHWKSLLDNALQLYEALVSVICDYADILIALPDVEIENARSRLEAMSVPLEHVYFYPVVVDDVSYNTWIRDHGPIAVVTPQGMKLLDFRLSSYGMLNNCDMLNSYDEKSNLVFANKISKQLQIQNAFPAAEFEVQDWALEGSAIETDGQGTLLTKTSYFLNKKINTDLSKDDIESRLKIVFGVNKIIWLEHGCLGKDSHYIDELVRFGPNNTIVYTACDDEQDSFYDELKKMESELENITNAQGEPFRLLPLPWPGAMYNDDDERLQVSYANFLVVNEVVLVPIYNALSDEDALDVIFQAFPGFNIMGIPCTTLSEQGGSLHRIAMQLPEGVLGF